MQIIFRFLVCQIVAIVSKFVCWRIFQSRFVRNNIACKFWRLAQWRIGKPKLPILH